MDAARFDILVRALTAVGSRRALGRTLASLALGGTLAPLLGVAEAEGKKGKKKKKKRGGGGGGPPPSNSPPPPPSKVCQGGTCGCPTGTVACNGGCVAGTCCPGAPCGSGNCSCKTATEGDTFCMQNTIVLCAQCANSAACAPGERCQPEECDTFGAGLTTAICRPVCAP